MSVKGFLAILTGAVCVSAHGFIESITINGKSTPGYNPTNAP